ncbi:hypothetical protein FB451DRAFT_1398094 [Mycena latifolia]|nr:hypothetical protein FB451DRAFT_1398094 [Mycena latifolia]
MSPRPPSSFPLSRATNLYAFQTRQASQPVTLSYRLNPVGDDCKLSEIKRAQSAVLNPKTLELLNVKATVKAQGSSLQAPQHQEVLPLSKIIVSSGPPGPLSAFLLSPSMSAASVWCVLGFRLLPPHLSPPILLYSIPPAISAQEIAAAKAIHVALRTSYNDVTVDTAPARGKGEAKAPATTPPTPTPPGADKVDAASSPAGPSKHEHLRQIGFTLTEQPAAKARLIADYHKAIHRNMETLALTLPRASNWL